MMRGGNGGGTAVHVGGRQAETRVTHDGWSLAWPDGGRHAGEALRWPGDRHRRVRGRRGHHADGGGPRPGRRPAEPTPPTPDAAPAATSSPGERRLARPPSDRYREAEAATAAAEAEAAVDPDASVARGVALAVAVAISGAAAIVFSVAFWLSPRSCWSSPGSQAAASGSRFAGVRRLARRPRSGRHRVGAGARCGRARSARPVAVRPKRGRRPRAARLSRPGLRSARFGRVRRGRDPRVARRAMSDDLRFRRPVEADHAVIVRQVDDWWGGRRLHDILPRLWFQHFTGTSWVVEDDGGGLVGFLVGFISPDHPDEAYIHMVGTSPNDRMAGLGRALYGNSSRTLGLAVRDGLGQSPGRATASRSGSTRRWVSSRRRGRERRICMGRRPIPTTTPRVTTGLSSAGNCDRGRRQLLVEQAPEP